MRSRTLVILATVVGALLALIYFAEDKVASTDERAAASKHLIQAKAEDMVSLELEWQGARVHFERDAKAADKEPGKAGESGATPAVSSAAPRSWRITEPFAKLADGAAVDRLAGELAGLEMVRDLEGAKRVDLGLDPPRGRVIWKTATAEGLIEIGGSVPASHDVIVAASGRRSPAVTADTLVSELSRPPGEWRGREVVTATRDRIDRVTLQPPSGAPVVLARSGETLRLASPVADFVDRDLADGLLGDLSGLRMETFLDPPLADDVEQALARRAGVVELAISGQPEPVRIEVGGERNPGKRVWRVGDQVFESASKLGDALVRPVVAWRSRSWTRFENWRIEKVRIEEAAGALELVRSDGEWIRDGKKIPFTAASDLLYALTAAKADTLVESAAEESAGALPAARPALTVTLSDADGNEELLTLEAATDRGARARTLGREVTLLLPKKLVDDLVVKISAVRAAEPVVEAVAKPR